MKEQKRLNLRIDKDVYTKIETVCHLQKKSLSEYLRGLIEASLETNIFRTEAEVVELAVTLIPDLQKQQQEFMLLKEQLKLSIIASEEASENVKSMKRGEGHHTKLVYETIKDMKLTLNGLMDAFDFNKTGSQDSSGKQILMNLELEIQAKEQNQVSSIPEKPKTKAPFSL